VKGRAFLILALAVGVFASVTAFAKSPRELPTARRTVHTIGITLKCDTRSGWVTDSSLHAAVGDTIIFELSPESDVTDFKIKKKRMFGRWLFKRSELDGAPGIAARGDDMKPDARGTYSYQVEGKCRGGPKAIIDPDIIIDI
jgi:hypothetical protein